MRKPQYSILADIQDAIEQAKLGKLALFWQRTIQREYCGKNVTPDEQQAYEQLQSILSEVPQWSCEEDLHHNMESIGGRVWFCHFWISVRLIEPGDVFIRYRPTKCGTIWLSCSSLSFCRQSAHCPI